VDDRQVIENIFLQDKEECFFISKRVYCFVGYDSDGKYTLNLYNKDAEVAESICKYLEIPRKE